MKKFIITLLLTSGILFASEYVLDTTHSNVGFSIKHLMISNVKGNFKSYDAELEFDEKTKTITKLEATIDTASVDTGIEKRDDHLKSSDFFNAEKFPSIKYVMTSMGKEYLIGNLTMNGITKEIKLKSTIHGVIKDMQGNLRVGFTLEGDIKRENFGLTWNKILESGGFVVGNDVKITIDIEAIEL